MSSILLLEDSVSQRKALVEFLSNLNIQKQKLEVYTAPSLELGRAILSEKKIDLILSDLILEDGNGIELLEEVKQKNPNTPFILITAEPTIETAIEAIRKGANDYLQKPIDLDLLKNKILNQIETINLRNENINLKIRLKQNFDTTNFIGATSGLHEILEKIRQIASVDVTVLIEGESGTGKEMIANLLHENSTRSKSPFLKVNCGALSKSILESELFGAVRGAYTGSEKDRSGYFEAADGGSLFLDEIGEMDLESQVRLLRVLEEKKITRVGSTKAIPIDVRIIAATNKNLLDEVRKGLFREDLYYRLSVVKLKLPPLRERKEDIVLLFNHFVVKLNEKYQKSVIGLSPELLSFMQYYSWPGNVRELHNVLEGMVVLAKEDILTKDDLPIEMLNSNYSLRTNNNLQKSIMTGYSLDDYTKAIIMENLKLYHNNRSLTAKALGISERTLYRKLDEYSNLEK